MDKQEERKKPHGNPYPRRGDIKKQIIRDLTGGSNGDNGGGGGGGGGGGNSTATGYRAD
jgi:hypothetical protein